MLDADEVVVGRRRPPQAAHANSLHPPRFPTTTHLTSPYPMMSPPARPPARPSQLGAAAIAFRQTNAVWLCFTLGWLCVRVCWRVATAPAGVRAALLSSLRSSPSMLLALIAAWAAALSPSLLVLGLFAWQVLVRSGGTIVAASGGQAAHHAPVLHLAQLAYLAALAGGYAVCDAAVAGVHALRYGRVDPVAQRWGAALGAVFWERVEGGGGEVATGGGTAALHVDRGSAGRGASADGTPATLSQISSATTTTAAASSMAGAGDDFDDKIRVSPFDNSGSSTISSGIRHRRIAAVVATTAATTADAGLDSSPPPPLHPQPPVQSQGPHEPQQPSTPSSRLRWNALLVLMFVTNATYHLLGAFSYQHPFVRDDNRHYFFYVWRRVLVHPGVRRALAPLYVGAALLSATRLASSHEVIGLGWAWVALWSGASACVLVPAHLVEPRYFMVPIALLLVHTRYVSGWAMLRRICCSTRTVRTLSIFFTPLALPPRIQGSMSMALVTFCVHVFVCVATLYVFLFRPFAGVDGAVGRIMW